MMEMSGKIDLRISGFEMGEIDVAFDGCILCANALMPESDARLLGDERAQLIFTDPPWNIPIAGHVSGLGSTQHVILRWAAARCRWRNSRPSCERRLAQTANNNAALESLGDKAVAAEDQAILDAYAAEILSRPISSRAMRLGATDDSGSNADG